MNDNEYKSQITLGFFVIVALVIVAGFIKTCAMHERTVAACLEKPEICEQIK